MIEIRDPILQPGSSDSVFNTPIGSNVIWSSDYDADTKSLRSQGAKINYGSNGLKIYTGLVSDSNYVFLGPQGTFRIRLPNAAIINEETNYYCFDKTNPIRTWAFLGCEAPLNNTINYSLGESTDITGSMENAKTGEFGLCAQIGVIRAWELDSTQNTSGRVQHSLHYYADPRIVCHSSGGNPTQNVPWPNRCIDPDYGIPSSSVYYSGNLEAGSTIGIPADIEPPLYLSQGGKILFWALQEFGAIWRGSAPGGITFSLEKDSNSILSVGMNDDAPRIIQFCHVMRNQSPFSKNGGGKFLVPPPPPIFLG